MLVFSITFLLFFMLLIGTPVGFALGISGAAGLYFLGGSQMVLGVLETTPIAATSAYELITIPMFLLMAEFVILSGIADSLFKAAAVWVGRTPGGLGIATAIAGAGFGAISGSSTASAATLSATTIPEMIKHKYEPQMACGVVAISGTLAMLIPPSVMIVLYAIIADQNVGKLLIAGVVPGLLVTLTIILTVLYLVWRDPSCAPRGERYSWSEKIGSLRVTGPLLFLFMAVTGVIYTGFATPTEAAGFGAFGAFILALKARKLTLQTSQHALMAAARTSCMILMIILGAQIFGYFFTATQTTQQVVAWFAGLDVSPWIVMTLILFMYLVLGCFMDQIAILILTVPVLLPVITVLGYDPIWFGIIVIVMAEVGLVTPPVGLNCYVVSRCTGRPLEEVFRGIWPHVVAHLILVTLLVMFPDIILWLPSTMK
jgi:tripartite ATP-independent transporter DctM subunit